MSTTENTNWFIYLANQRKEDGWEAYELVNELKNPKYEMYFLNYFEAVLNQYGRIFLAVPSHERVALYLASKKLHMDEETISWKAFYEPGFTLIKKANLVYLRYHLCEGKPNRFQCRTIDILHDNGYLNFSSHQIDLLKEIGNIIGDRNTPGNITYSLYEGDQYDK